MLNILILLVILNEGNITNINIAPSRCIAYGACTGRWGTPTRLPLEQQCSNSSNVIDVPIRLGIFNFYIKGCTMDEQDRCKVLLSLKETASEFELKHVEFRGYTRWTTPECMDMRFVDDQKMIDVLREGRQADDIDAELQQESVASLKRLAHEYDVKSSGRKSELIQRIAAAMKKKKNAPEKDLRTYTCLKCSPYCNVVAYEFPLDFASNTQCRARVVFHGSSLKKIITHEDANAIYMFLKKPAKAQFVHVANRSKTYSNEDEPCAVFGTGPCSRPDLDAKVVAEKLANHKDEGDDILLSKTHVLSFPTKDEFDAAVAILENGAGLNSGFKSIMESFPLSESDAEKFLRPLDSEFSSKDVSHELWNDSDDDDDGEGGLLDSDQREGLYVNLNPKLTRPDYSLTDSDFLDHIDLGTCSEWARKSIQRWGLLPPFDPRIDDSRWKLYYMERATVEWWNKANGNIDYAAVWNNFGSSFQNGIKPIPDGECIPWDEEFPKPDLLSRVVFNVCRSRYELIFEVNDMRKELQDSTEWVMDDCLHLQDHFETMYKRRNISKMFSDGIYVLRPPISDTGYDADQNQVIAYACRCYSPFAIGTSFDVYFDHLEEYFMSAHDHTNVFVRPRLIIDCDATNIFKPLIKSQERFLWCAYALCSGEGSRTIKSLIKGLSPAQIEYLFDPVGAQPRTKNTARKRQKCSEASLDDQSGSYEYEDESSDGWDDASSDGVASDDEEYTQEVVRRIENILSGDMCPTSQLYYLTKRFRNDEWCVRVAMQDQVTALVHTYFGMKQPVSALKMFSWIFYMATRASTPCDLAYGGSGDSMIASTVVDFSSWLYGNDQYGELRSIYPKYKNRVVSDPFLMVRSPHLQKTRTRMNEFGKYRQSLEEELKKIKDENPEGRLPVSVKSFERPSNPWVPKRILRRSKEDYYSEGSFPMKTLPRR